MELPYGFDDEAWMQPFFGIAHALRDLGNAGAVTTEGSNMGAIECLSLQVANGSQAIAGAINNLAEAIREQTDERRAE